MEPVMPKRELKRIVRQFLKDMNRGISIPLFAELCGISDDTLRDVFLRDKSPMSEMVQRRVDRAYREVRDGKVAVMMNRDQTRFIKFRKVPEPRMHKSTRLTVENGQIRLKVGMRNRLDYSTPNLDEQLGE